MTEQIQVQLIKAKVEFDFDSVAFFTIDLSGPTIDSILDQIDMIETKVIEWGEKNCPPETSFERFKRHLGFKTYRGKRNWNAKEEAQKWIDKP